MLNGELQIQKRTEKTADKRNKTCTSTHTQTQIYDFQNVQLFQTNNLNTATSITKTITFTTQFVV
jgi:flagellin-specific chaperone FliS